LPDAASRRPVLPLMGLGGATKARTRGIRTVIGSARRAWAYVTPSGWSSSRPCPGRSRRSALHALACPFRDVSLQPRTAAVEPMIRKPSAQLRPAVLPLLGFRALRHNPGPADPHQGDGSLRHRVPRAGFGYPLRGVHHRSSRRARRRSVHGLHPSRPSPRREGCPSRGPCPPDVASRPTPRREQDGKWPPSGPRSRDEFVQSPESRRKPAVDAFLGFSPQERSPHPPGPPLVVTAPALSPSSGMTSLPAWTSGLRGSDGSAWSVSGLPALLGFGTFRPSRHSVHRPGERAHGFTSRRTPRNSAAPTAI
jgi:hypothetical protein